MVFGVLVSKPNTMKPYFLLLLAIPLFFSSCYTTQHYSLTPHEPVYSFWEDGKQYSYNELDSIIVSIGFDSYENKEFIFDLAIDNHSDSAIKFDPSEIYVFRYDSNSTLESPITYHPSNPTYIIDSLERQKEKERKRITRNTVFGVILGIAVVTAAVAIAVSDDAEPETASMLIDDQIETQAIINETCDEARGNLDDIEWQKYYWENEVMNKNIVESNSIKYGRIHLRIPYSPKYIVYIPINNRICRFAFNAKAY